MMRSTLFAALLSTAFPVAALAQTADDLKNDAKTTGDVLVYGMGYSGTAVQSAHPDQQGEREQAGPGVGLFARRSPGRRRLSRHQGRRHLRDDPQCDGGGRRHDRQADLAGHPRLSAGDPARRLLRHRQSRRRDLRGHDHSRAHGRPARRARRQDRQRDLDGEIARPRDPRQRLRDDGRAADRQWRGDHGRGRRRVQPSRLAGRI